MAIYSPDVLCPKCKWRRDRHILPLEHDCAVCHGSRFVRPDTSAAWVLKWVVVEEEMDIIRMTSEEFAVYVAGGNNG